MFRFGDVLDGPIHFKPRATARLFDQPDHVDGRLVATCLEQPPRRALRPPPSQRVRRRQRPQQRSSRLRRSIDPDDHALLTDHWAVTVATRPGCGGDRRPGVGASERQANADEFQPDAGHGSQSRDAPVTGCDSDRRSAPQCRLGPPLSPAGRFSGRWFSRRSASPTNDRAMLR
jgi:hypothetical protein